MEAAKGSGMLNMALNVLKANPIVLVVTTLAGILIGLFSQFKKMEGVSDSLGKAWGALSGVFSTFINKILTPLIEGFVKIVELLTSGVIWVLEKTGIATEGAAEKFGQLTEALDDLEDAEKNNTIALAESNRKLQDAREIAADANLPIRERIKALREAAKTEKEELDKVVEYNRIKAQLTMKSIAMELGARAELIAMIQEGSLESLKAARMELMSMQNVDKEKLAQIDSMIIAAEDAAAKRAKIGKKTEREITGLEKEEQDKRKAQHEEYLRKKIEREEKAEREWQERLDLIQQGHKQRQKEKEDLVKKVKEEKELADKAKLAVSMDGVRALAETKINAIAKEYNAELQQAEAQKRLSQIKVEAKQRELEQIANLASVASDIAGQQTVAGKAFAVASTSISTYLSAQQAYNSQFLPIPDPTSPIRGAIAAAAAIGSGLARLKTIMKVQVPGKASAGASGAIPTPDSPLSPTPIMTRTSLNASSIQAVGNAAAGGTARAFVLESDIANNRERIERINRAARI